MPRGSRRSARSLNEKPTAGQPGQTLTGIPETLRDQERTTGTDTHLERYQGSRRFQPRDSLRVTSNGGPTKGKRQSATHPNRGRRGCGGRQLRQQPLQERRWREIGLLNGSGMLNIARRYAGGVPRDLGDLNGVLVLTFVVPGSAPDPVLCFLTAAPSLRPSVLALVFLSLSLITSSV